MLATTKGIVLKHFKYSDNSVIAKIYTQDFGLRSFIVRGVRSGKGKNKASYLQPLSLVQITSNITEKKNLLPLKSIQLDCVYADIPFNIVKTSLAFFISEVLVKSIKEEEPNPEMFEFIYNALQLLDVQQENIGNYHLIFMTQMSRYLGFHPQIPIDQNSNYLFDLQEGTFLTSPPPHQNFIDQELSSHLITLYSTSFQENNLKLNHALRKSLLGVLLNYYHLHLSNFDNLKSIPVLEEVLN